MKRSQIQKKEDSMTNLERKDFRVIRHPAASEIFSISSEWAEAVEVAAVAPESRKGNQCLSPLRSSFKTSIMERRPKCRLQETESARLAMEKAQPRMVESSSVMRAMGVECGQK